jgi:hypothetical protein
MWRRHLLPFGRLAMGDRVVVIDTYRGDHLLGWEHEVNDVAHEAYLSHAEAARPWPASSTPTTPSG